MAVSHSLPAPMRVATPEAHTRALSRPPRTYLGEVVSRLRQNRTALVVVTFIALLIGMAIATPWIAPYDYPSGSLLESNQPPSPAHWLGTDPLGCDELT